MAKQKLKFKELTKRRHKPQLIVPDPSNSGPSIGAQSSLPLPPFEIIHSTLEPPEDLVAAIGEINMATTQILADQFDLSNDELLNGLPLIDMSKTKFWEICPLFVKQDIKCELTRFRSFTAHCNNLKHPTWGAAMTPYARYLPPVHPDGIWVPRKSIITEITYDVGEGHREMHSNLAPSMPMPAFDQVSASVVSVHHHTGTSVMMQPSPMALPPLPIPVHRLAVSNNLAEHQQHGRRGGFDDHHELDEELLMGASVNLARHTRLTQQGVTQSGLGTRLATAASVHEPVMDDELYGRTRLELVRRGPMMIQQHPHSHNQQYHKLSSSASASAAHPSFDTSDSNSVMPPETVPDEDEAALRKATADSMAMVNAGAPNAPASDNSMASTYRQHHHHPSHHHKHIKRAVPQELPTPRLVTSVVHRDADLPNHDLSILFMSWGQLLDHDMTRAAQPPSSIKCCGQQAGQPKHKLCLPIPVPPDDPFYSQYNVNCLEFRRTLAGVRPNCVLGPRVHQNAITSPIDANFVYGSSRAMNEALRLFKGGRLRDRDWFRRENLKPLLPAQEINPDLDCIARPRDLFCFMAGDVRVNEQTHLTVLHTLYMREHNRIADKLAELNPHWDDNRIFHETRHIVAAGVQHVMLNEYIPLLIGRKMAELYNLTAISNDQPTPAHLMHHAHPHHPIATSYWRGYDPTVTTSVSNSFAAAAFRQGHTFVQGSIERWNKFHEFVASEKLRHLFKQPFLIYQPGVLDELTSGMLNQESQSYDPFISEDISGHLFQPPEQNFGHDLAAINLQRGRDQGLPGYNLFREWCGLPRAETFEQLEPYLTNRTAYHYSRLYKHVDDIDLWSAGVSERKLPGAAIGPTFACIIARQFSNTRRGDRFWYENPDLPSSFTPEQLAEIRKTNLAKILCANSDDLPTIQRWPLRMAHPILNPRIDCNQLPEPNLAYWQEE